jgi:hypothetical protein
MPTPASPAPPNDPAALVEIEAIKQLKARYFRLMDTRQWDAWESVFTEDATLKWGPADDHVMRGRAAIRAGVSGALEGATTVHHGHMPEIELISPDRARGIWAMFDRVDHPRFLLLGFGHYHEQYEKRDGAWQIARLELVRLHEDRTPRPE